jgi:hypothetical protein
VVWIREIPDHDEGSSDPRNIFKEASTGFPATLEVECDRKELR